MRNTEAERHDIGQGREEIVAVKQRGYVLVPESI